MFKNITKEGKGWGLEKTTFLEGGGGMDGPSPRIVPDREGIFLPFDTH